MADKKFDLGDYVEVKDRVAMLMEYLPQARIVTTYELTKEPDDKPKVISRAMIYRDANDPSPTTGTSWMYLPGSTPYTKGSEIENAETSAIGRAIGFMGILIGKSIASGDEIAAKKDTGSRVHVPHEPQPATREQAESMEPVLVGPWTGTGKVDIHAGQKSYKGVSDGNLRSGPGGVFAFFSFETVDDKTIPQVRVNGAFAAALIDATAGQLHGLVATIAGDLYSVPWEKDGKRMPPFQRLELHHIDGEGGLSLPVAGHTGPGLFDPETEAELDAALLDAAL